MRSIFKPSYKVIVYAIVYIGLFFFLGMVTFLMCGLSNNFCLVGGVLYYFAEYIPAQMSMAMQVIFDMDVTYTLSFLQDASLWVCLIVISYVTQIVVNIFKSEIPSSDKIYYLIVGITLLVLGVFSLEIVNQRADMQRIEHQYKSVNDRIKRYNEKRTSEDEHMRNLEIKRAVFMAEELNISTYVYSCDGLDVVIPGKELYITGKYFEAGTLVTVEFRSDVNRDFLKNEVVEVSAKGIATLKVTSPQDLKDDVATITLSGSVAEGIDSKFHSRKVRVITSLDKDTDKDATSDVCDNCPNIPSTNLVDSDKDGRGDACDVCRYDREDVIGDDGDCLNN